MARVTWLADVLRAAGVQVAEVDGWRTRGREDWGPLKGVIYHATADKANSGPADARDDAGAIAVIRDGRPGLDGPIANAYVNREGVWHVIAAGRCNTVRVGTAGPLKGLGNSSIMGIEAENDNRGEHWPAGQLGSLRRGFAAILRELGLPASRLAGHYEHQPTEKTDPFGIDMNRFRGEVAAVLAAGSSPPASQPQETDMLYTIIEVPADATDCNGIPVVETSRCVATPAGPWALTGLEAKSLPDSYWPQSSPKVTWKRLLDLCAKLNVGPVTPTPEQWAQLTAAIVEKVGSAAGAALAPAKLKAGTLEAFREIGANIPPAAGA